MGGRVTLKQVTGGVQNVASMLTVVKDEYVSTSIYIEKDWCSNPTCPNTAYL
jgi:hypothetical protein